MAYISIDLESTLRVPHLAFWAFCGGEREVMNTLTPADKPTMKRSIRSFLGLVHHCQFSQLKSKAPMDLRGQRFRNKSCGAAFVGIKVKQ